MIRHQDLQRFRESETEENSATVRVYFARYGPEMYSSHLLARALNGVERLNIKTMDELVNVAPEVLAGVRNIGPKSLKLILLLRARYMDAQNIQSIREP